MVWLAFITCICSFANARTSELDSKQLSLSVMFASMGLVNTYLGPAISQGSKAWAASKEVVPDTIVPST